MAEIIGSTSLGSLLNRINDTKSAVFPTEVVKNTPSDVVATKITLPLNVDTTIESSINLRRTVDVDNEYQTTTIGNFNQIGKIRLYGDYPQNSVDLPKFDLSKVTSLNTNIANFNFILSLKTGDSEPKLFANKDVMIDLIAKYGKSEPIPVNYLINERKLVVIDLEPLNLLTEQMRATELGINLNSNKNIEVSRNLFTYSNYVVGDDNKLVATPSYDLTELIKYITWVVTKPNQNYDERLLSANVLGEWNGVGVVEPGIDEASTDTTNTPDTTDTNTQSDNQTGSGNQTDTGFYTGLSIPTGGGGGGSY